MICSNKPDKLITKQQGFALVVVIVVLLLASFLASQLIFKVKSELIITHNVKARAIGSYLAEGGMNMAIFRLVDKPIDIPSFGDEEEWQKFFEGYNYEFFLPLGKVIYYAVSETGKIDLNKANPALMKLFLEYHLGKGQVDAFDQEDQVTIIMDSLADWLDNDDFHRLNGAESEFYQDLDDPYIARNGKLEDPSEFFLVNGTAPLIGQFDAMDVFSVYNTSGKINFNSLTPAMLDFVTNGDQEKIDAYREAKFEFNGTLNASTATQILGEERYSQLRPFLTYSAGSNKYYFIVGIGIPGVEENIDLEEEHSKANPPGSKTSVLIKKESSSKYSFMAWQERYI